MNTVQYYLQQCDKEELIQAYIAKYPITINCYSDEAVKKCTAWELLTYRYEALSHLIDIICKTEVEPSDYTWVFFAHPDATDDEFGYVIECVRGEDLQSNIQTTLPYAYEFCEISETAGWYIADTEFTLYHLQDVLIDYLYESSFFGYAQEYLDEALKELQEKLSICEDLFDTLDSTKEPTPFPDFLLPPKDDDQIKCREEYFEALLKYNKHSFEIEAKKVVKLLSEESE